LSSCEDIIDINLDAGTPQLSIDAWITDQPGTQTVKLRLTRSYFDNSPAPLALNATVEIEDSEGNIYQFLDADNDGDYVWMSAQSTEIMGVLGRTYTITVSYNGETYKASSQINRTPRIDSLVYEFREERLGNPAGYYAEIYARDPQGSGDCYWIRTYKNGKFLNRGQDINIAYDAGFSAGGNVDGVYFITPIREGINPFFEDPEDSNVTLPPYSIGDDLEVEIYSIQEDAFYFLQEVSTQLTNGGLFAVPLTNVRTNYVNQNPNSDKKVVGYFGASAVVTAETTVEE
jgi:hypothetical protein